MSTNSEGIQASIRAVTGTAWTYEGDWHALFDQAGIAVGPFEGRLLAWINVQLSTAYTSVPQAQQALAVQQGFYDWSAMNTVQIYSAEAQAAFAAMTTQPSAALKRLYNTAIVSLKTAGVWTKLDALYLMNVETAQAARLNLKSPGTYDLTATSSPTFTAKVGYTGDGAAAYLNSNFNPSTAITPNYVQDSAALFAWCLKVAADASPMMGQAGAGNLYLYPRFTDNHPYGRVNTVTDFSSAGTTADGSGLLHADRTASNLTTLYKDGASIATSANVSAAPGSFNISILRWNTNFFGGGVAMAGFGSTVGAQASALRDALNTFKTGVDALP